MKFDLRPPGQGAKAGEIPLSFGSVLRAWRQQRGLSHLDLALDAGISSRHLSFLETGRAHPSREMVYVLQETLQVPLRDRNRMLLAAGFAPAYSESDFAGQSMTQVRKAVRLLLDRHEPYPAYAMDGAWEVIGCNRAFDTLLRRQLPGVDPSSCNILRLFLSPEHLRPSIVEWEAAARAVLLRVVRQLDAPVVPERLAAIVEEVRAYEGIDAILRNPIDPSAFDLLVPVSARVGDKILRWITTAVTFGGVVDITLADLVVECFFPADEQTEEFMDRLDLRGVPEGYSD